MSLDQPLLDALATLARDHQPTRYPDALPEGTPMGHYGASDSSWAMDIAEQTLDATASKLDDAVAGVSRGRARGG